MVGCRGVRGCAHLEGEKQRSEAHGSDCEGDLSSGGLLLQHEAEADERGEESDLEGAKGVEGVARDRGPLLAHELEDETLHEIVEEQLLHVLAGLRSRGTPEMRSDGWWGGATMGGVVVVGSSASGWSKDELRWRGRGAPGSPQ